jgi:hypothetical protein
MLGLGVGVVNRWGLIGRLALIAPLLERGTGLLADVFGALHAAGQ